MNKTSSFNSQTFIAEMSNKESFVETGVNTIQETIDTIERVKGIIGSEEYPALSSAWEELAVQLKVVQEKYAEKKNTFLDLIRRYRERVLLINDEAYQDIQAALQNIKNITDKIQSI